MLSPALSEATVDENKAVRLPFTAGQETSGRRVVAFN